MSDDTKDNADHQEATEPERLNLEALAIPSHEIRGRINVLVGAISLLSGTSPSDEQRQYIEILTQSADALLTLTNRILDLSRLQAGKTELDLQDFSLPSLVENTVKLFEHQAAAKKLSLGTYVSVAIPELVRGDALRVQQILLNLIDNAITHTDAGGINVRAIVEAEHSVSITVRFSVTDTGVGIHSNELGQLFQPFAQASRRARGVGAGGGIGLGLAIAKRFSELMGGTIEVESAPGKGSTFSFTVRFGRTRAITSAQRLPLNPENERKTWTTPRPLVLVVDGDQPTQKVILRQLEQLGIRAHAVKDGREALQALERRRYDLVLMECLLLEMDGWETTRTIRQSEIQTEEHLPIVALTAAAGKNDRDKCVAAGMDDYLAKPVSPEALGVMLERWLKAEPVDQPANTT